MALIQYVTQIQFDFGAIRLLRQECERVGIGRPLIVTDAGVKAAGIVDRALVALAGGPGRTTVPVFDQTPPNPTEAAAKDLFIQLPTNLRVPIHLSSKQITIHWHQKR
ncbi:iron-containing alcohol dehydrogenase [Leptospira sp. 96542]|nr:iron-containing alcohol dehydrogenase [Leptospira sp. 96542]